MSSNGETQGHGPLGRAVGQVTAADGTVVGACFLVGPDTVATCAHVAAMATGADAESPAAPTGHLQVEFSVTDDSDRSQQPTSIAAVVEAWSPIEEDGSGDVALLRLASPAPGRVPPLRRVADPWGHAFRVLGFPEEMQDGVWVTGELRASQGTGWVQLEAAAGGQELTNGFSGAPVWDAEVRAVVGMTVAASATPGQTTAYLIPIERVLGLDPDILPNPYRGLEAFQEEHAEFFCGRAGDIDRLVAAVDRRRLIAVTGRSGTGKSSLVLAGLIPRLREQGYRIRELRPTPMVPPRQTLALMLVTVLHGHSSLAEQINAAERIEQRLAAGEEEVARVAEEVRAAVSDRGLLVFVDQLEEVVADDPGTARDLLQLLAELTAEGGDADGAGQRGVRVVLTLRWDACDELLVGETVELLEGGIVTVAPMTRAQLREAVDGPATRAPGLYFEDGLVERILDDAGDEPGSLPLVESLLTQLWGRHEGGYLTSAAYDDVGGVAGAVAQHAERALSDVVADDERFAVRQLLTMFAHLGDDDQFDRQPVPLTDLTPTQQSLVERLAAHRLVVVGQDAQGAAFAELAHQALIDHWPRLRNWLTADREFLHWHRQLERQVAEWEESGRDHGALLRRGGLARAQDWLADRSEQISVSGREFIEASTSRQRRDVRRSRSLIAVFAALALVAGVLAAVAYRSSNNAQVAFDRLSTQLASSHASELGRQASARIDTDTSTQLALAAWRADPSNVDARTAIGRNYFATRSASQVFTGVSRSPYDTMWVSDNGRAAATEYGDGVQIITNLDRSKPTTWRPPGARNIRRAELSPDGTKLAAITASGHVLVWNITERGEATRLGRVRLPDEEDGPDRRSWKRRPDPVFSPDSRRVLIVESGTDAKPARLRMWNTDSGDSVEHGIADGGGFTNAWQTSDPNRVMLQYGETSDPDRTFVIRDLDSGTWLRTYSSAMTPVRRGASLVTCGPPRSAPRDGARSTITVHDTATGEQALDPFDYPTSCGEGGPPIWISRDTNHLLRMDASGGADNAMLTSYSLIDGKSFTIGIPPPSEQLRLDASDGASGRFVASLGMVVSDDNDGTSTAYIARNSSVYRFGGNTPHEPHSAGQPRFFGSGEEYLTKESNRYVVRRAGSAEEVARLDPSKGGADRKAPHGTVSGNQLVLTEGADEDGTAFVSVYTLPSLRLRGRVTVTDDDSRAKTGAGTPAAVVAGDTLITLSGTTLSAWNIATGRRLGGPTKLASTAAEARWLVDNVVSGSAAMLAVPGQPGAVTILRQDGTVEIWDAVRGKPTKRLPVGVNTGRYGTTRDHQYAVDPSGAYLGYIDESGRVQVWDIERNQPRRAALAVGTPNRLAGFTGPDQLAVAYGTPDQEPEQSTAAVGVWNLRTGGQVGQFISTGVTKPNRLQAGGLTAALASTTPISFSLDPNEWARHLCRIQDRPFTDDELDLLPDGVPTTPPCRD